MSPETNKLALKEFIAHKKIIEVVFEGKTATIKVK